MAVPLSNLDDELARADLVLISTASPKCSSTPAGVVDATGAPGLALLIVDVADSREVDGGGVLPA